MYELNYKTTFDAAHFLPNHKGKCKNLHGHTWKVLFETETIKLDKNGMVIDFGELKKIVNILDHRCLNDLFDNPTAEYLAVYFWHKIKVRMNKDSIIKVTVWESEKSSIAYKGELC
jgi:6-pyruvoyltetrahydropterin/6-carboxytetrahydropterin synthase